MNQSMTICLFLTLIAAVFSIQPSEIQGVNISDERDLANFIKAIVGENHENMNEDLKQYVSLNKISIMNAAEEVALILTEGNQKESSGFQITPIFMKALGKHLSKVTLHDLSGKSSEEIAEYKQNKFQSDQRTHEISGNKEEIAKLIKLFNSQKRRMLEETMVHTQDATTFGYITKFFFGLLFLIVTLTLFLSIACMENRKDSLLYAKFIADVGR